MYLRGNSLKKFPREITEKDTNCAAALINYLRASFASGDIINNEAKCIFFGNSGVVFASLCVQSIEMSFNFITFLLFVLISSVYVEKKERPPTADIMSLLKFFF